MTLWYKIQPTTVGQTCSFQLTAQIHVDLLFFFFKVCKSVHHRTFQINRQPDATIFPFYYADVYLQLNMFRASSRPSSGAQQLQ